ncbi:HipA domain-containing protein [Bradyrhizobium sp. SEMIA]|uniref:HipA domain-containing protein n=1 Tax=Bradyrhizobium sp. SEMIA TaxID=2597515 RepID=UPI0018A55F35|nr:HipA domain-containing protein [Bradyrhizobium sp. SEMIA]QOG21049.1 hypothetical protein FOM02_30680 [Bradyrhizobium sp. SEMIA]
MLGKSPADVIGLLAEMVRDTAGALSIGQPGTALIAGKWREIPDQASLERILNELPHKPFLVGEDGVSMSLAGVQTKLAIALDGDTLYIPINGAPSTHIIKPDGERLPGAVQNEAFCLTLARMIGIPTPKVTTGTAGGRSYLLVERYDRRHDGKRWRRLHQEDFCQALGRPPAAKYQNNDTGLKGPSLADMLGVTLRHMTAQQTARFVDLAIFNPMAACNRPEFGGQLHASCAAAGNCDGRSGYMVHSRRGSQKCRFATCKTLITRWTAFSMSRPFVSPILNGMPR